MDEESHSTSQDSSNSREAVQMTMTNTIFRILNHREETLPDLEENRGDLEEFLLRVRHRQRAERRLQRVERRRQRVEPHQQRVEQGRMETLPDSEENLWNLEEFLHRVEQHRQRDEPHQQLVGQGLMEFMQRFELHRQRVERRLECLPRLVITDEHEKKHNGLECAICLDPLSIGSIVNQLPCLHFFHPLCIVPWLKVRMSCPTCRYKLSSAFHIETRQNSPNRRIGFQEIVDEESNVNSSSATYDVNEPEVEIVHEESNVNSSSATYDVNEPEVVVSESYNETTDSSVRDREGSRGGWFLFAAAPIVSLVGIALVECFQNFLGDGRGRGSTVHVEFSRQCLHQVRMFSSGSSSTRTSNSRENN